MSEMENNENNAPQEKGLLEAATSRGVKGMFSGLQTGGLIAGGLIAAFMAIDGLLGTHIAQHLVFGHAETALAGAATFTGVHCLGAAAFEGVCEAYDGIKGDTKEHDHIKDAAQEVDSKLLELEGATPTQNKANAYQFDNPQPKTSPVIQALVAQGATQPQAEQWRERLAAQQLSQMMQDRTV